MGRKTIRKRLKLDEAELIENYRRIKEEAEAEGVPVSSISSGWIKNKNASLHFKNPLFSEGGTTLDKVRDDFRSEMIKYSPNYEIIPRPKRKDPHLFVINISDLHIGKLSSKSSTREKYNVKKAVKRAKDAVSSLLEKSMGFEIDKIFMPLGNDILHVDNSSKSTTKGTQQDVDGNWHDNFKAARELYVEIIEQLIQVADVHICHTPSNHDYVMGYCLSDAIYCWFNKSKNITFDLDMNHRKYFCYGNNLIGISHGDGAKVNDLPLIMANESPKEWSNTKFRYWYLGHIHHKEVSKFRSAKDYHGVTVEYLRSPSAADTWHSVNGYQHSKQAIEAFLHHPKEGQIGRFSHNF